MEKKTLTFRADNQILVGQNVPARFASDTVSYIEAVFDLGENWSGFDAVKAVWSTDFDSVCTVLDSSGACVVPWEVLERVGDVCVNLVGSISENDSLTDRLTTYPVKAITVDANAAICGSETGPITPSQFDQFVEAVRADADRAEEGATAAAASASAAATSAAWSDERATDSSNAANAASQSASGAAQAAQSASESAESASESAQSASDSAADAEEAKNTILDMTATATTLPEGSEATVDYSGGVMAFGIPRGDTGARGAKGDTGETGATPQMSIGTVETLEPDEDATATITGTAENPVLNLGLPKGETGEVSLEALASLMPLETVSGSVASFSDGSAVFDAEQALISLEPIQSGSGTPSPDNVRPISGHDSASVVVSGINIWDEEWEVGGLNASAGNPDTSTDRIRAKNYVSCKGNTAYYFLMPNVNWRAFYYDADKTFLSYVGSYSGARLLTTPQNARYIKFWCIGTTYNHDISINYPSTDTEYHPSQGVETYTAQFPSTVYGGTVDLVSGVLTVDRAMVDLGTLDWSQYNAIGGDTMMWGSISLTDQDITTPRCSHYKGESKATSNSDAYVKGNGTCCFLGGADKRLYIRDDEKATYTRAEFKASLSGAQLVYKLATPQTYQLTPQAIALLTGDNNVWSADGQIQVKYRANIGLYVDKKISEVSQ